MIERKRWTLNFLCVLAVSFLLAPAALAQAPLTAPSPAFSCANAVQVAPDVRAAGLPGEPVVGAERLIYEASDLVGPLEVRYHVAGSLYLTEKADLAGAVAARPEQTRIAEELSVADLPSGQLLAGEAARVDGLRVIDLLALRPDLVRRLRAKADAGETVTATIVDNGVTLETVSLAELSRRAGEFLQVPTVPVKILSEVTGPGAELAPVPVADPVTGCGTCGPTVPCDADGPFDPDKGDCVGCAEVGDCDPGPCACSTVLQEYWGSWYVTGSTPIGPYGCLVEQYQATERVYQYYVNYRRNRIQVQRICPNCPACTGCYNQQVVVNYQTQNVYCYGLVYQSCQSWDSPVYPSSLCP